MSKKGIHCFIAIRFGESDTDAIYARVESMVSQLGLLPRRIDRLEHIENINQKIIRELDKADIAIADLTYARPSVYFEAGYAHRKIPVIYTCRKDHLHNERDDLKVHFDVDRYNLIFWYAPNDEGFIEKLKSRLQIVMNDLPNMPLIKSLKSLQSDLYRSPLNPANIFNRMQSLRSQLDHYPRVASHQQEHESNIEQRMELYKNIIEMIQNDFPRSGNNNSQMNQWMDFYYVLEGEIDYLERLFEESNYGGKVMYGGFLHDLYKMYLETMIEVHQRPSDKYQETYARVKSWVEKIIHCIESPF